MPTFQITAIASLAALILGASCGYGLRGILCDTDIAIIRQVAAEATAKAEHDARAALADSMEKQREDLDRLAAESEAAQAAARKQAADLAARLKTTQTRLSQAIRENQPCATWASQSIACPVSWAVQ